MRIDLVQHMNFLRQRSDLVYVIQKIMREVIFKAYVTNGL